MYSILIPLVTTLSAHVENGHGLISRANLDCFKVGQAVTARSSILAQNACLINIFPRIFASQYVVYFLALERNRVFELLIDAEYVGARFAEEAEVSDCFLRE